MDNKKTNAENPNTAMESDTPDTDHHPKGSKRKKKQEKKHHHHKKPMNFNIPGVHKLVLGELTQKIIGCVVGENVTAEKPWMHVEKEMLQENIELHSESSEFLPIKEDLFFFAGQELLLGYIPDETREYDEFYLCVTETATDQVKHMIEKMQRHQEERLHNAINKKVGVWTSLGSENEVDENILRNNRALIEVEVESKYPILPFQIHFKSVKTYDMKDGYMELKSEEEVANVQCRRIDTYIQVTPSVEENEAQTVCTYPRNAVTQYEYDVDMQTAATEECFKMMAKYIDANILDFFDLLRVNGHINLYSNDYKDLVVNQNYCIKAKLPKPIEYLSFINKELCEGKKIAGLTWHPMLTGIVAMSYVDIAPSVYLKNKDKEDEVNRAVHGVNPVLLWSFLDDLNPRLILESPREVYSLSFCPFQENILIGGLNNGQIIIWDITNKLNKVEEEEILTNAQQKYRTEMNSLMNWMKNIHNIASVRPTAISDLKYSHKGCVRTIRWMSPTHKMVKTGKIEEILEDQPRSLQLLTAGEDGTILIWDLLIKPTIAPGGFRPMKRLRRLKKRPSALLIDLSPFKALHLNLKPIYCVKLILPFENNRPLLISCMYAKFFYIHYKLKNQEEIKQSTKLSERLIYEPSDILPVDPITNEIFVGTMGGNLAHARWEGQEFDSGEVVNFEEAEISSIGSFHDGPIVRVALSGRNQTILTVGGNVFALWKKGFNRPILWRRNRSIYTHGSWNYTNQSMVRLSRGDGFVDYWSLAFKSKDPIGSMLSSNGPVNFVTTHPRELKSMVFGDCDHRGSLRLFHVPYELTKFKNLEDHTRDFFDRELDRKRKFLDWQTEFNKKFNEYIEMQHALTKVEEKPIFSAVSEEIREPKEKREKKKQTNVNPVKRYLEWVKEERDMKNQARLKQIILEKKQLDTEELLKQREPLRKLEEENELKRRKQRIKLRQADKIFRDTVAMLFPDVVKEKPIPPPDPYEWNNKVDDKVFAFKEFHQVSADAQDYVDEHPFMYDFSWNKVLKEGKERRSKLTTAYDLSNHRNRHKHYKELRNLEIRSAADTEDQPREVGGGGSAEGFQDLEDENPFPEYGDGNAVTEDTDLGL